MSTHLHSGEVADLGPVRSAANYTAATLSLLGVGSGGGRGLTSGVGIGGRGHDGTVPTGPLPPTREIISAMVELRRAMRQAVLEHKLENAKQMKR